MTRSVRYHPEAAEEVQGTVDWYRKRSAEAAAGFIAELDYAIEQVSALPETWPGHTANTRRYVFRVYPYALIYRLSYLMVLQPVENLRDVRPMIEERVTEYVQRTAHDKRASPETVLQDVRTRLTIRKEHNSGDQLYWITHSGRGKWEGEMKLDMERLLRDAALSKRQKLKEVSAPVVLLLLDRYHHRTNAMWKEAAANVDLDGFHTVARIWQDGSTLLLHSTSFESAE